MRPQNLQTKIFLDSGDPAETKQVIELLGFLDGQTTNPTLVAKHPKAKKRIEEGKKFSKDEIFEFYKNVVTEISRLIPNGSVSIEVYADKETTEQEMFTQGKEMFSWIPNAHVKYPTTTEGLKTAEKSVAEQMRVNMTLVFSEEQAAAVYGATRGAKKGGVFLSPFIGRLDDIGQNGMELIDNILKMYGNSDHHVEVLTASVRNLDHFLKAIELKSDIITAPFSVIEQWVKNGMQVPEKFDYHPENLSPIQYKELDLSKPWQDFDIKHELTDKGIDRFASDWNGLVS